MNPIQESDVFVEFYSDAVHLKAKSEKEGRPIYEEKPHVRIIIPGDKGNVIERVCKPADIAKYPNAWKRFQSQESVATKGTPLEQWPQINRAQLKEAKYFEVHSVEQMAALSDSHIARMGMGFQALRDQAKAWLDAAQGGAQTSSLVAENKRLSDELEAMKAQMAEMNERYKASQAPARRTRETAEA